MQILSRDCNTIIQDGINNKLLTSASKEFYNSATTKVNNDEANHDPGSDLIETFNLLFRIISIIAIL